MRYSIVRCARAVLLVVVVAVWGATVQAKPVEIRGTSWPVIGSSRLKVQKVGKGVGRSSGRIDFKPDDQFALVIDGDPGGDPLLVISGTYQASESGRRVLLVPNPDSVEKAIQSLLAPSVFDFALRGIEPGSTKLRVKLRSKKDTNFAIVKLVLKFVAMLALQPEDPENPGPEVVEPFRMTYRYKGSGNPSP